MKKFKNAFDFVFDQILGEVNEEPSQTQPEMTMSLQEILRRYTRGGEVATLSPVYQRSDDFEDAPEIEKMDATERLQYALDLKSAIKRYQNRVTEIQKIDPEIKPDPEKDQKEEPPKGDEKQP